MWINYPVILVLLTPIFFSKYFSQLAKHIWLLIYIFKKKKKLDEDNRNIETYHVCFSFCQLNLTWVVSDDRVDGIMRCFVFRSSTIYSCRQIWVCMYVYRRPFVRTFTAKQNCSMRSFWPLSKNRAKHHLSYLNINYYKFTTFTRSIAYVNWFAVYESGLSRPIFILRCFNFCFGHIFVKYKTTHGTVVKTIQSLTQFCTTYNKN